MNLSCDNAERQLPNSSYKWQRSGFIGFVALPLSCVEVFVLVLNNKLWAKGGCRGGGGWEIQQRKIEPLPYNVWLFGAKRGSLVWLFLRRLIDFKISESDSDMLAVESKRVRSLSLYIYILNKSACNLNINKRHDLQLGKF